MSSIRPAGGQRDGGLQERKHPVWGLVNRFLTEWSVFFFSPNTCFISQDYEDISSLFVYYFSNILICLTRLSNVIYQTSFIKTFLELLTEDSGP